MNIVLTRHRILQLAAAGALISGGVSAFLIMRLDRVIDQGKFLADIVTRNAEHLEEFDFIALEQLGVLKKVEKG